MKRIAYFVKNSLVTEEDKEAAAKIQKAAEGKVIFRNAAVAEREATLEKFDGVTGPACPARYAEAFPCYDSRGQLVGGDKGKAKSPERVVKSGDLNAIGLPVGKDYPEDRDALKKALTDLGVDFHGNAKTEALADLFLAKVEPQAPAAGQGENGASPDQQ